jgi:CrcB protein
MLDTLAVAFGGAAGSLLRYGMSVGMHRLLGGGFPYGTLTVNVVGSWLIGLLYVLLVERSAAAPVYRLLLMVGFLGGFTTFSSFSIETLNLIESGELFKAALNVGLSVGVCLAVCWFGMATGRAL